MMSKEKSLIIGYREGDAFKEVCKLDKVFDNIKKIVEFNFEAHRRLGMTTKETEMRFSDILNSINILNEELQDEES